MLYHSSSSSPSVSLEKGAYRIRERQHRPAPLAIGPDSKQPEDAILKRKSPPYQPNIVAVAFVLALLSFSSFALAYYLFASRLAPPDLSYTPPVDDLSPLPPVQQSIIDINTHIPYAQPERYITYLHHSGFNNQRISLENALVLAALLNRTLIFPPVRLGNPPVGYAESDRLRIILSMDNKKGLRHCLDSRYSYSAECESYHKWTYVSWSSIIDLDALSRKLGIRLIERWDLSSNWFERALNITDCSPVSGVKFVRDNSSEQFAFTDADSLVNIPYKKYQSTIPISALNSRHRLIHLGTVFGTTRLRVLQPESRRTLQIVRESMAFSNPTLEQVSTRISKILGRGYVGVHLRLGDGIFEEQARSNARDIWWKVLLLHMGLEERTVLDLEASLSHYGPFDETQEPPVFPEDRRASQMEYPPLLPAPTELQSKCRSLHKHPDLQVLNTPIFISTDSSNPTQHPVFSRFLETFPCIFFVSDLDTLRSLDIVNEYDGVRLRPFLSAFIEAMVAGMGSRVVGTPRSTFSRFIEDVLWRKYHGFEIISRGGKS